MAAYDLSMKTEKTMQKTLKKTQKQKTLKKTEMKTYFGKLKQIYEIIKFYIVIFITNIGMKMYYT